MLRREALTPRREPMPRREARNEQSRTQNYRAHEISIEFGKDMAPYSFRLVVA